MHPKLIWANVGVRDLERTTQFYTRLGFTPNGRTDQLTSFKFGDEGFVIHFFLREVLQSNIQRNMSDPLQGIEIIHTLSAASIEEADAWSKEVEAAGGTMVSKPEAFGPGYYGFAFADPDGHTFNVFYMQ